MERSAAYPDFLALLKTQSERLGAKTALSIFENDHWRILGYRGLYEHAVAMAKVLHQAGLEPGDRVILWGTSSIEWVIHFFAVMICRATAIPMDTNLKEKEIGGILDHSEPRLILVSEKFKEIASNLRHRATHSSKVLVMEPFRTAKIPTVESSDLNLTPGSGEDHLAVICYTSGTYGTPKAVQLTASAMLFDSEMCFSVRGFSLETDVTLSILPFFHLYGLNTGLVVALLTGEEFCMAHELSMDAIVFCVQSRAVTQILAVPLFVTLLHRGIEKKIMETSGPLLQKSFKHLLKATQLLPVDALRKILFGKIQKKLGSSLRRFICGGAELNPDTYEFFRSIGIPVYVGYGLTETGPVVSLNTEMNTKVGSVGRPLPEIQIRIQKENETDLAGEVQTKGKNLMCGYYHAPELTQNAMTSDGWFRTGDLGNLDEEGFLFIRGRLKSLIVLSSGKKVHPEEVEALFSKSANLRTVCVVDMPSENAQGVDIVCVMVPTDDFIKKCHSDLNLIQDSLMPEVMALAQDLSDYKRPVQYLFSLDPLDLTSTAKVKRDLVREKFKGVKKIPAYTPA